jgi:hypothetical protein
MKRLFVVAASVAAFVGAFAAVAGATGPRQEVVQIDETSVNDGTCSFPFDEHAQGSFKVTSYYDSSGNLTKQIFTNIGGRFVITLSANGKSVTGNFGPMMITFYFDANGNVIRETENGLTFLFTVPGSGVIEMDVGRVIAENDEHVFIAGPHDFISGNTDALCAYLADP